MYESFLELGNFKRRGVKDGTHLYEIKNVKADHVALIEFAFHDNLKEAKFIIENKALIAQSWSSPSRHASCLPYTHDDGISDRRPRHTSRYHA